MIGQKLTVGGVSNAPVWSADKTSLSGGATGLQAAATDYFPCNGYTSGAAAITGIANPVPYPMTLRNLYVLLSAIPGPGSTVTFTVYVNNTSTPLSVVCTETSSCYDTTHSAPILAGQSCAVGVTFSGSPTAVPSWAIEGDNP